MSKEYRKLRYDIQKYMNRHGRGRVVLAVKKYQEKDDTYIVFGLWGNSYTVWKFNFKDGFYNEHVYNRNVDDAYQDFLDS